MHFFRIELIRSVRVATSRLPFGPDNCFLILFVLGIAENFQDPIIT